jgi:L-aminopeptidase/D-esterase-like protein
LSWLTAITIGALVAVNPMGSATIGDTRHFWAAPFEIGDEFGGLGMPSPLPAEPAELKIKFRDMNRGVSNTTIAVIATDASSDQGGSQTPGHCRPCRVRARDLAEPHAV